MAMPPADAVAALVVAVAGGAAVASVVWFTWRTGIAPMPSMPRACRAIADAVSDAPPGDVADLGAGWGTLAITVARRHPGRRVVGYERSWLPWATACVLARLLRVRNVSFQRRDFHAADLRGAAVLLCYLFPGGMAAVAQRLRDGDWKPSCVISHTFALPGLQPQATLRVDDLHRSRVLVYRPPWK